MKTFKYSYIKYGLLMCLIIALCLALMELTGNNESFDQKPIFQAVIMFLAPFVVWYFGIKAKKKEQNNFLSFKQGLKEGFKISVIFAIVSPFVFTLYYTLVNPEIISSIRSAYSLGEYTTNAEVIGIDMGVQVISALVFGTVISGIISFFLKTKPQIKVM